MQVEGLEQKLHGLMLVVMEARLIVVVMVLFLKFAHKWLCCIPTLQYMCILHRDHFELLRIACLSNLVAMLDEWDKDVQYHIALRGSLNCTEENDVIIIHDKTGGSCID